jgi:hypothetical protein
MLVAQCLSDFPADLQKLALELVAWLPVIVLFVSSSPVSSPSHSMLVAPLGSDLNTNLAHDRLGDAQRGDLGVGDSAAGIPGFAGRRSSAVQ